MDSFLPYWQNYSGVNKKINGLEEIINHLRLLERKVSIIEKSFGLAKVNIKTLIESRDFSIAARKEDPILERIDAEELYASLKSYYFRRFLGDVSAMSVVNRSKMEILKDKWSKNADKFLEIAREIGLVRKYSNYYRSLISVNQYGAIFEWFISQFVSRELGLESIYGVHLKNLKDGGDIDVFARDGASLIMIECKESPPNNVPVSELKTIFKRVKEINPDIFILVIDTTLSIQRNIIDNLEWIEHLAPSKLREGVYALDRNILIVTARRDLLKNISYSLKESSLNF